MSRMMIMMEMTEDIVGEIFLWLPVKSMYRFKCLSKVWYRQISDRRSSLNRYYLTGFTTRRETRIVGTDDSPPTIVGFMSQHKYHEKASGGRYDRVRFLPITPDDIQVSQKQLINLHSNQQRSHHNIFTLDVDPLEFLLSHLRRRAKKKRKRKRKTGDEQRIFVDASCNGFLVCSLETLNPVNYYLCNPVTKEWLALPKPKTVMENVVVGFVCKGYPCLDLVEYTIVRAMTPGTTDFFYNLSIEILCNGDDQWRQFSINSWGTPFSLNWYCKPVMLSTNTNDVIMCCSVRTEPKSYSTTFLMFSLNNLMNTKAAGEESFHLQPWMIEAPGMIEALRTDGMYYGYNYHIEGFQGVLHYLRFARGQYLERWILNMDLREWMCKNRVSIKRMIERSPWIKPQVWGYQQQKFSCCSLGIHPTNPNMIFIDIDQKKMWCNIESESLELAPHYVALCSGLYYSYQWPCWPPLL